MTTDLVLPMNTHDWFVESAEFVLHSLQEGIQFWDQSGRLVYANPATIAQFGDAKIAQVDTHWLDWLPYCRWHGGLHCSPEEFPVARVLSGKQLKIARPIQIRRGDESVSWVRLHAYPRIDPDSRQVIGAVSSTVDVTQLIEQERRLKTEAHYDNLTGLPNRTLLADRVQQAVARSRRTGEFLAVCLMDLDGFKAVNDTLGHSAGDKLLQEIARRLGSVMRAEDTAARLGGDEFALLIGGLDNSAACEPVLKRLLAAVAAPISLDGQMARVTASIGVTLCPLDTSEPEQLMRHADQAMYRAKQAGKNCFDIFNQTLESKVRANQGLLRKIEQAIERNEFRLFYQPKVDCRQGRVVGLEALIRWQHPILGIRAPGEFLPLIEQDDLIIRLGEWTVTTAMTHLQALHAAGHPLTVSINIAAHQFLHGHFCERLAVLLQPYPSELVRYLEIEILESAALEDIGQVSRLIKQHQAVGVNFSLDDFGTGYSSLSHLKHLPVDTLKIDQTFVRDMLSDNGDLSIVQAVIGLASSFQRKVVAEGVESIEQLLMLMALGCDVIQGYVIARPMSEAALSDWLAAFQPDPRWRLAGSAFPSQSDFQLLLLESDHNYGFEQVMSQLAVSASAFQAKQVDCRFSRWLVDPVIRQRYGENRLFHEMELAHTEYHRALEVAAGKHAAIHDQESSGLALRAAHEKFGQLLKRFRIGLAATGSAEINSPKS